jgi:hypothetical protein
MKYAVELGSGAMIYIPSLIQIGSGIQKLTGENTDTEAGCRWHIYIYIYGRYTLVWRYDCANRRKCLQTETSMERVNCYNPCFSQAFRICFHRLIRE